MDSHPVAIKTNTLVQGTILLLKVSRAQHVGSGVSEDAEIRCNDSDAKANVILKFKGPVLPTKPGATDAIAAKQSIHDESSDVPSY